jgi:hypothetical protein
MNSSLQDEIISNIAKQMQQDIDEGIMSTMLIEDGWTPVQFYFKNNKEAVDITEWLCETCEEDTWGRYGNQYLFKNKQDAEWFILRWV